MRCTVIDLNGFKKQTMCLLPAQRQRDAKQYLDKMKPSILPI